MIIGQSESAQSEPARIYMWTVHRIEIEGTDVQLYCRAAGYPAPIVTWYDRDDNKIAGNNANYKVSDESESSSSIANYSTNRIVIAI